MAIHQTWIWLTSHVLICISYVFTPGDMALLVDTSHPMIRPELEKELDRCRKIIQSQGKFCLQV